MRASSSGRTAADVYALTGGNPFLVTEVLAAGAETVPASVRELREELAHVVAQAQQAMPGT